MALLQGERSSIPEKSEFLPNSAAGTGVAALVKVATVERPIGSTLKATPFLPDLDLSGILRKKDSDK
ncbi:MAG: hypothetical protein AAGF67_03980, partial [Verrucomicrobiota bacterium]